MFRIRSVVRSAAVAIALAVVTVPVVAMAGETAPKRGERHHDPAEFPMPAKTFRELVEKRIQHAREHLAKQLDAHKVPAIAQTEIKKRFEEGAKVVRQAADQAAADGTVTKDEADKVKTTAKEEKKKGREQLKAHRKGEAKRARKS